MPDFGLFTALSAQPDIQAQRDYQDKNAAYANELVDFARQQTKEKQTALNQIGDYFGAVDQQINELLPEDMKRVQGVWDKNKQAVIDKLKEYGNDPQMFMRMGGATVVKKFANDFYRSPEMQSGIKTKEDITSGLKDMANPELEQWDTNTWKDANEEDQTGSIAEFSKTPGAHDFHYAGAYQKPKIADLILKVANTPNGGKPFTVSQMIDLAALDGKTSPAAVKNYIQKNAPYILDPTDPTGQRTVFKWGSWKPTKESGDSGGWGVQHEMPTLNDSQTFNTPFRNSNGQLINTNLTGKEGFRIPPKHITLSNTYVKANNPDADNKYDTDVTGAYFTGAYKFPVNKDGTIISDGSKNKADEKYFAVIQVPEKSVKGTFTFVDGNFVDQSGIPAQMKTFYVPLHGKSGVGIRQQIFKNPANVNNPIWDSGATQEQPKSETKTTGIQTVASQADVDKLATGTQFYIKQDDGSLKLYTKN